MAVRSDLGGGTGTNGRDTYFFDAGAVASLAFSDVATVNGSMRYSPGRTSSARQRRSTATASTRTLFCTDPTPRDRCCSATRIRTATASAGQRLYFGIGITAAIDRFTSFFLQIEGLPFADQLSYKPRLAFMDAYNGALIAKNDHFVYGMAGITAEVLIPAPTVTLSRGREVFTSFAGRNSSI